VLARERTIVVLAPGAPWVQGQLPESRLSREGRVISGGERSLYELATAMSQLGYQVELRGALNGPILTTVTEAAGTRPRIDMPSRELRPDDLLVIPEGGFSPSTYAEIFLSGVPAVLLVLAPPGLFGWSFRDSWSLPDPLTVPLDSVGTVETFSAITRLGFSIWTPSRGTAAAVRAGGVPARWIGTGTPVEFPKAGTKTFDVALVQANRWSAWAEQVAQELSEVSVLRVPEVTDTYSLCSELAPARVLLWPSRIEGMSRVAREARAVGTVPIALDKNPFVTQSDHGRGLVLVPDLVSMAAAARKLLSDRPRWRRLSDAGVASARAQVRWAGFVARVEGALAVELTRPFDSARAAARAALATDRMQATEDLASARAEVAALRARRAVKVVDQSPVGLRFRAAIWRRPSRPDGE
jgi:hypothetical protein